jgi:hypothetical protein
VSPGLLPFCASAPTHTNKQTHTTYRSASFRRVCRLLPHTHTPSLSVRLLVSASNVCCIHTHTHTHTHRHTHKLHTGLREGGSEHRKELTDVGWQGKGMDRKEAVQILEDVEKAVKLVVDAGYSLHSLTPSHVIMQVILGGALGARQHVLLARSRAF